MPGSSRALLALGRAQLVSRHCFDEERADAWLLVLGASQASSVALLSASDGICVSSLVGAGTW